MLKFKKTAFLIFLILTTSCYTETIEEPVYRITFQTNNDQVVSPVYYDGLSSIILPESLVKEGYKSEGWYLDADFQTRVTSENINLLKLQQDNTFHHKWLPISYKINYFLNGGVLSRDTINSFDINQLPVTLPIPSRNGLIFQGWYDSYYHAGEPFNQIANISNDNLIYFAKWGINEDSFDNIVDFESSLVSPFYNNHSSFLTRNGRVFTWGGNNSGQLGDGTRNNNFSPQEITSKFKLWRDDKIIKISLGTDNSAALSLDGRVFTWGSNSSGQLGHGDRTSKSIPTEITNRFKLTGGDKIMSISLGGAHSLAISSTGRVFTWGSNSSGQIGNGNSNIVRFESPQEITQNFKLEHNDRIVGITSGQGHAAALSLKGRVFTWGANSSAQLGEGTWIDRYTPQEITQSFFLKDDQIVAVFLGGSHSAALSANGSVFFWGSNRRGQLGNLSDQLVDGHRWPSEIKMRDLNFEEKIISIELGSAHSLALSSKNRIFAWGRNDNNQLSEWRTLDQLVPVEITKNINFKEYGNIYSLKASGNNSAVITSGGHVLVWGENKAGQIGDSTTKARSIPYLITFNQPSD